MYRHCIYCSAELGANEAVEGFPVGRTVAFDGEKGRLWAVCPKCARWNLAPIEARWEAVEEVERVFRDTRLRVQSENVGLTRLRDGTKLVRIGAALPGEVVAWRYGRELRARWWKHRLFDWAGLPRRMERASARSKRWMVARECLPMVGLIMLSPALWPAYVVLDYLKEKVELGVRRRIGDRIVYAGAPGADPGRPAGVLRRRHLVGAYLAPGEAGEVALHVPTEGGWVQLDGAAARDTLARGMAALNARGATRPQLEKALDILAAAPSPDAFLTGLAQEHATIFTSSDTEGWETRPLETGYWLQRADHEGVPPEKRWAWMAGVQQVKLLTSWDPLVFRGHGYRRPELFALEIALHQESERRAMEGELTLLEAAWREAEEIASIADRLAAPALPAASAG